eukprot:gene6485-13090_t
MMTTSTKTPTRAPSPKPTRSPTKPRSTKPTRTPSRSPTFKPTKSPSSKPTKMKPTSIPTRSPSQTLTRKPTKSPSSKPTVPLNKPTSNPTRSPSKTPLSRKPTRQPSTTAEPTSSPVQDFTVMNNAMCDFAGATNAWQQQNYVGWQCDANGPIVPICSWYTVTCTQDNNVLEISFDSDSVTVTRLDISSNAGLTCYPQCLSSVSLFTHDTGLSQCAPEPTAAPTLLTPGHTYPPVNTVPTKSPVIKPTAAPAFTPTAMNSAMCDFAAATDTWQQTPVVGWKCDANGPIVPVCDWSTVTCTPQKKVLEITFDTEGITGTIPNTVSDLILSLDISLNTALTCYPPCLSSFTAFKHDVGLAQC